MTGGADAPLVPRYRFTGRSDGDLAASAPGVGRRRQALLAQPWTWLHQVHGAEVVVVDEPGAHAGVRADAAVTTVAGAALCVTVADCAPVALLGDGAVGVVHAGWRGLAAGVLGAAVEALHRLGATTLRAVVGPCIEPACYEFGGEDLDTLTAALGPELAGRTGEGAPALDLVAGVRAALAAAGVGECDVSGICTACSPEHWSHRGSATTSRQALVATLSPGPA